VNAHVLKELLLLNSGQHLLLRQPLVALPGGLVQLLPARLPARVQAGPAAGHGGVHEPAAATTELHQLRLLDRLPPELQALPPERRVVVQPAAGDVYLLLEAPSDGHAQKLALLGSPRQFRLLPLPLQPLQVLRVPGVHAVGVRRPSAAHLHRLLGQLPVCLLPHPLEPFLPPVELGVEALEVGARLRQRGLELPPDPLLPGLPRLRALEAIAPLLPLRVVRMQALESGAAVPLRVGVAEPSMPGARGGPRVPAAAPRRGSSWPFLATSTRRRCPGTLVGRARPWSTLTTSIPPWERNLQHAVCIGLGVGG